MRSRVAVAVGAALLVLVGAAIALAAQQAMDDSGKPSTTSSISRFFELYVDSDGRVVRHDQGGDTVSEGQAYAMLLAVASGDEERFDRVWRWTKANLQRNDGLLAYHWRDGGVVDPSSAADADLDTARALLVASQRFRNIDYRGEALRIAKAVLAEEVVTVDGRTYLVAGPWARDGRKLVDPSYFAPQTWRLLASATRNPQWEQLRADARAGLRRLAHTGLPSDWAAIDAHGWLTPVGPPDASDGSPVYGLDAQRVPLRYAESCDSRDRQVAARLWPKTRHARDSGEGLSYTLDGQVAEGGAHPAGDVGAAAAAAAAGDSSAARGLLRDARRLGRRSPTYYGSALVALGTTLLTSDALGGCPALNG